MLLKLLKTPRSDYFQKQHDLLKNGATNIVQKSGITGSKAVGYAEGKGPSKSTMKAGHKHDKKAASRFVNGKPHVMHAAYVIINSDGTMTKARENALKVLAEEEKAAQQAKAQAKLDARNAEKIAPSASLFEQMKKVAQDISDMKRKKREAELTAAHGKKLGKKNFPNTEQVQKIRELKAQKTSKESERRDQMLKDIEDDYDANYATPFEMPTSESSVVDSSESLIQTSLNELEAVIDGFDPTPASR